VTSLPLLLGAEEFAVQTGPGQAELRDGRLTRNDARTDARTPSPSAVPRSGAGS
jgi:hypothetical protein